MKARVTLPESDEFKYERVEKDAPKYNPGKQSNGFGSRTLNTPPKEFEEFELGATPQPWVGEGGGSQEELKNPFITKLTNVPSIMKEPEKEQSRPSTKPDTIRRK